MNWIIREAQSEDAEGIVGILNPIIEGGIYTVLDTPFTVAGERAFISNFPQRGIFHVALNPEDQKVVEFQNIEPFATYTRVFDHVGIIGT